MHWINLIFLANDTYSETAKVEFSLILPNKLGTLDNLELLGTLSFMYLPVKNPPAVVNKLVSLYFHGETFQPYLNRIICTVSYTHFE